MTFDITDEDLESVASTTPTLYDIHKSLDVVSGGIVGEEKARLVVFTNFVLGSKPVILKGSRASGKSNCMRVVGTYCKKPITISTSSEKVYPRMGELNSFTHFIIPEINQVHQVVLETLKAWGEGVSSKYSYLNPAKVMETVTIEPKPFMTSIADENKNADQLGEELISRMTVVRMDSGVVQNTKVIDAKLSFAENPLKVKTMSENEINRLLDYVHNLPSISSVSFVYPPGSSMLKSIPPLFTDSRRDVEKYLFNTYAITLFHCPDRISRVIDGKRYYFVSPADVWYNHRIYQDILMESSLKCGLIEQEIIGILTSFGDVQRQDHFGNKYRGLTHSEVHTKLLQKSYTPTVESVKKFCNNLTQIGYLLCNDTVRPYRYEINPELSKNYEFTIDWNFIVDYSKKSIMANFPDVYEEYVTRYCSESALTVVDPFTGERKLIVDKKPDSLSGFTGFPSLKERVVDILKDGLPRNSYDLSSQLLSSEKEVDDVLIGLERMGDVFTPRPGYYKLV